MTKIPPIAIDAVPNHGSHSHQRSKFKVGDKVKLRSYHCYKYEIIEIGEPYSPGDFRYKMKLVSSKGEDGEAQRNVWWEEGSLIKSK